MVNVAFRQQQRIAAHIVDDRFQMQTGAHVNRRHRVAVRLNGGGKFADPLLIGTRRQADKKSFAHQQHVAAVHMSAFAHLHQWTKPRQHRRNSIDFALAARRARMSNHRQFRHDHRGIFNKVRIGIFRRGRKHGDLQAELQKGLYIGEKLARGGSDIRRAQLGGSLSCAAGGGR